MTQKPMQLRLLIVDDEEPARLRTRRLLEKVPHIEVLGEASNGREALQLIEDLQPDVVLLDIQMPGLDGMRLVEALDDPPAIIFATAFEEHAVRAFDLEVVDYLLKPFSAERLSRALERARRLWEFQIPKSATETTSPKIPSENGNTVELLAPTEIAAARIEETVVFLLKVNGERTCFAGTLQELEEQLAGSGFIRCSRQALINRHHVQTITPLPDGTMELKLAGNHRETVSRRRARILREMFGLGA
ncbi:MAG: LytTR family DNA-binding domain-containing protein [Candidatus Sumerlaeia bacterium]|nr:LytTR family DNA-binding domain-containing protein [Candidatus Sumerlaeia bacterium]